MNNRSFIIITIGLILSTIIVGTLLKVEQDHSKKTFLVIEKRITEGAIHCIWDDVCSTDTITLGFLIQNGYAKEEVNPTTKMYYNHDSYVKIENNNYTFIGF